MAMLTRGYLYNLYHLISSPKPQKKTHLKQAADQSWLVVSTPLKNMKVNGKDDIPYMKWKIKAMFEPESHGLDLDA